MHSTHPLEAEQGHAESCPKHGISNVTRFKSGGTSPIVWVSEGDGKTKTGSCAVYFNLTKPTP